MKCNVACKLHRKPNKDTRPRNAHNHSVHNPASSTENIFIPIITLPFAQQQPTGEKFQTKGVHESAMINTKSIRPKKGVIVVYLRLAPSVLILPVVSVVHTTDHCVSSNYHDVVRVMGRGTATGTHTRTRQSTASLWTTRNRYNHARIDLGRIDPDRGGDKGEKKGHIFWLLPKVAFQFLQFKGSFAKRNMFCFFLICWVFFCLIFSKYCFKDSSKSCGISCPL